MPAQRKDRAISLRNRSAGAVRNGSAREVPAPPSARDTVGRLSARDVRTREGRNLLRPNLSEKLSLVPGTSSLSVLTDWRRSPAYVHKSPGRAGARPSRWCVPSPFGRHAPRTAQVPRTPPLLPFRSEIPQFTFTNEISLRNKVSTSYLCHNSRRSRNQIELLVL